jgi:hypothetical protein
MKHVIDCYANGVYMRMGHLVTFHFNDDAIFGSIPGIYSYLFTHAVSTIP